MTLYLPITPENISDVAGLYMHSSITTQHTACGGKKETYLRFLLFFFLLGDDCIKKEARVYFCIWDGVLHKTLGCFFTSWPVTSGDQVHEMR